MTKTHQSWFLQAFQWVKCQIRKHLFSIFLWNSYTETFQTFLKIFLRNTNSIFEIQVSKCVSKNIESLLKICVNYFDDFLKARIIFHLDLIDLCLFITNLFNCNALLIWLVRFFWLNVKVFSFVVCHPVHYAWMGNFRILRKYILNLLYKIIHQLYFFLWYINSKRIFKFFSIFLRFIFIFILFFITNFSESYNLINKFEILKL